MSYHNNRPFSTKDRDNDRWSSGNCAEIRHGAFWYEYRDYANLNGEYLRNGVNHITGVWWWNWKYTYYSLKRVEMKIKPN